MKNWIKPLVKRLCGEQLLGVLDYYRLSEEAFTGPFNGQQFRQQIFRQISVQIPLTALVETGTFRGTTTEYLHQLTGLPVDTVELHPRCYSLARHRLRRYRQIRVHLGDSRRFLQALAQRPDLQASPVFFYLDAHWYADLPLREEIELVFRHWPQAVVMIDDFRVPDDADYHHDAYGEEQVLCLDYLNRPDLATFFPAQRGMQESGARRGCVVLAQADDLAESLRRCDTLREYAVSGSTP